MERKEISVHTQMNKKLLSFQWPKKMILELAKELVSSGDEKNAKSKK